MLQTTLTRAVVFALAAASFSVAAEAAQPSKDRYIVKFKDGKGNNGKSAIAQAKGQIMLDIDADTKAIEVPAQALKGLANNPNVEYIEEDVVRYPLALTYPSANPGQVIPYGIKLTQSDLLSDANAGNRKVCIIDSGYDNAHEDLNGNPVTGEYDSGTGWWYTDENHHGTHVAGTIAGINNSTGVVGVNPNKKLKLHIVKVFSADGWAYSRRPW
jgi:subtilisin family serine protease